MTAVRRKCFISYHHTDQTAVNQFIDRFDHNNDVFIYRGLGVEIEDDIINSDNPEYVMLQIRERYLQDSTVTLVMLGQCTWARRYVDWEIQASLRNGEKITPKGLLGVKLPAFSQFPDRFNRNLLTPAAKAAGRGCYASYMNYPSTVEELSNAIEGAFQRRTTHAKWIDNPRERMSYNRQCP